MVGYFSNQLVGDKQSKFSYSKILKEQLIKVMSAFPAVITAGICDTILISLAVAGVSIIIFKF